MRTASHLLVAAALALAAPSLGPVTYAEQSRSPTVRRTPADAAAAQQAPAKVALSVGGKSYQLSASARCVHAARASMYDKPGQYWTVELPNGGNGLKSLLVTAWHFNDKSQTFNLTVDADANHRVSTMSGTTNAGRGTVTVSPRAAGGRFVIDATTQQGVAIKGTIDCERFAPAIAAGG